MLGSLIRANLLTEFGKRWVVMHDVVREMALWIASDFGKQTENFVVRAGVGLHEIPEVKDWGAVRRMSLMKNNIEEITCSSKCSELTTLFLQINELRNLSGEFIRCMQKLVVLDLALNRYFNKLPEQISELASLQYLDLSYTNIEQLPVGFHELKNLTQLDLSYTERLCSVGAISKLWSLRILKLRGSNVHVDVSLVKELQLLEHLQVLTITISTEMGLEQILDDERLANCITELGISAFQQKAFNISLLTSMENLRWLHVASSNVSEIDKYMKCKESKTDSSDLHNPKIPCFTNLSRLNITSCHSIKDLTWLLFAPNLVDLHISDSREVEEIINKEKATNLTGITPFQKLEFLSVEDLPKLESIYWSPLPFPLLKHIFAHCCPKLRKLPLNATSVPLVDEFKIEMDSQETELEWEDEDTKNRFLPSIVEVIIAFNLFCLS